MSTRVQSTWRLLPLLATLLAAAPAWAGPGPLDETFQRTYPMPSRGQVTLANVNGSVRIEGWEKDYVEVRAVKRSLGESRDLQRVRIEVETLPQALNIRTRYPENNPAGVEVEYRIKVPYQVSLSRVETVNGNVFVSGMDGAGDLLTVNGDVDVYESSGRFSGKSTNGHVRVELRSLASSGQMTLESVNGPVALVVPPGTSADLDVRSMNGEFHTELPLAMQSSLGREFRGSLGKGGMSVQLRTVNGGIEIVILRATI